METRPVTHPDEIKECLTALRGIVFRPFRISHYEWENCLESIDYGRKRDFAKPVWREDFSGGFLRKAGAMIRLT